MRAGKYLALAMMKQRNCPRVYEQILGTETTPTFLGHGESRNREAKTYETESVSSDYIAESWMDYLSLLPSDRPPSSDSFLKARIRWKGQTHRDVYFKAELQEGQRRVWPTVYGKQLSTMNLVEYMLQRQHMSMMECMILLVRGV